MFDSLVAKTGFAICPFIRGFEYILNLKDDNSPVICDVEGGHMANPDKPSLVGGSWYLVTT